MPKPILIANWKNFPSSLPEAKVLMKGLKQKSVLYKKVRLVIAPPLPYFETVAEKVRGLGDLGAQDLFPFEKGVYTGAVPPEILKSFGVKLVIVGHSERRALGETATQVAEKAKVALKTGLTPLVCFGEALRDADGEHFQFLQEEIKTLLSGMSKKDVAKVVLAYEPIWAIGKKSAGPIDPLELAQTIVFVRKVLTDLFGRETADQISILYGGSVDETNAGLLLRNSGARGFLVGRASLNPKSLEGIVRSILAK